MSYFKLNLLFLKVYFLIFLLNTFEMMDDFTYFLMKMPKKETMNFIMFICASYVF